MRASGSSFGGLPRAQLASRHEANFGNLSTLYGPVQARRGVIAWSWPNGTTLVHRSRSR
jgi:hypothetical protein